MKKMAMIFLVAAQALTLAAQAETLLFCNVHNRIGQNGALEVLKGADGTTTVQMSMLGQQILGQEVATIHGNQYGHKIVSKSIELTVTKSTEAKEIYEVNTKATGQLKAALLGEGVQTVRCEYTR